MLRSDRALKVCAETVPADADLSAVPSHGYRRWSLAADLPFIGLRRASPPGRRAVGRAKAAGW